MRYARLVSFWTLSDSRYRRWARALAPTLVLLPTIVWAAAQIPVAKTVFFSAQATPPVWTVSGVFDDRDRLLLSDPVQRRVFLYRLNGTAAGSLPKQGRGFDKPALIQRSGTDILLEEEDGRLLRYDSHLRLRSDLRLTNYKGNAYGTLRWIFGWAPLTDSILAYGDIQQDDSRWISAFVRVPLKSPVHFTVVQLMEIDDPIRTFYLLGHPYIASLGNRGYFLVMGRFPFIVEHGPEGSKRRLNALTGHVERRPLLSEKRALASSEAIFREIEEADLPVGLYARNDFLYVLLRQPTQGGKTTWSLVKVDPRRDRALWHRPIMVTANHLTVIPGAHYWAFVQKGSVNSVGAQKIESFQLVRTAEIEAP